MKANSLLVAHNVENTRTIIKTLLKDAGYHYIATATNGRQIFNRLERSPYDLLITAPVLSDINCWQLLRAVATGRFCSPRLPMLVICKPDQIPLLEPLAQQHHTHLLSLDELGTLAERVLACLDGIKKPAVLVIEDDMSTARLIKSSLSASFEVEIAQNGEDGLEAWRVRQHTLILLDLMLPGMHGPEVMEQIRTEKPDQIVSIITARSELKIHQNLLLSGAAAFLIKPIDLQELPYFCEKLLHDGVFLSQCAQLEPQQQSKQRMIERIQIANFLLETGQTGLAAEQIKHALAGEQEFLFRDDEWVRLMTRLD